ncbi:TPA: alanine racemase [Candidatus Dependentiae bacterium]|nr:alanine racemase [Candidatus Dependentiae bacterium]
MNLKMSSNSSDYYSWIELHQGSFDHNVQELYKMRGPAETLGLVVKANAYGHGLAQVARFASCHSCISHLFVSTLQEAFYLRSLNPAQQIVALIPVERTLLSEAIASNIELVVYSFDFLKAVVESARHIGKKALVHIKIDTGLGRLGFLPEQLGELVELLEANKDLLSLRGCMTHYAQSGTADHTTMFVQRAVYGECIRTFLSKGISFPLRHAAASGGFIHMDSASENFARIGTAWTGIWKSCEQQHDVTMQHQGAFLQPVLHWKTRVMQVKDLPAGSAVGYQGRFVAQRRTKLLLLPVGYADGYAREFYPGGWVLVGGRKAPVAGLVSMNVLAVDGTECPDVLVGDEVLLLGGNGEQSVSRLARLLGVGELDLFTRLSDLLPRIIV